MAIHLPHLAVDLTPAAHTADGAAPVVAEWQMLVPAGTFRGRDGRGPYTSDAAAVIAATRAFHGATDIPTDYDHQLVHAARVGGTAPASGWVTALEERDGAVWGRVRWTAKASAHIAAGEYRYLSPVIPADADGRVLLLHSVGLVNKPNFDLPVAALEHVHAALSHVHPKELPVDPELIALLTSLGLDPATYKTGAGAAHCAALAAKAKALDGVIAGLELPADTTPEAVAAGVTALKTKAAAADAHAAGAPDPAEWVPKAAFDELAGRVTGIETQTAHAAAQSAVAKGVEAGKISPALAEWAHAYAAKDPTGFELWLAGMPVVIKPGAAHSAQSPAGVAGGVDADEAHVAAALGLSVEEFKKAKEAGR